MARLDAGTHQPPFWRRDWPTIPWLAGLYLFTLALRLLHWRTVIDGDEAWHFFASQNLGREPDNLYALGQERPQRLGPLTWWRPLFVLALSPFAQIGFDAWRLGNILVTAAIPPLAFLCIRANGARLWAGAGAGMALAVQPVLQRWSPIGFADGMMTALFLAALWRWLSGRPWQSAALVVAACWTKETALIGAAFLAAWAALDGYNGWRRRRRAPLQALPMLFAPALGAVPLLAYLGRGGRTPGWATGVGPEQAFHLVFVPWLVVALLVGLAWPRTRGPCGLALSYVVFHFHYTYFGHHAVEPWYAVLPGSLAIVGTFLVLDELPRRLGTTSWLARAPAAGVVLLLAVQAFVPHDAPGKADLLVAQGRFGSESLVETLGQGFERDRNVQALFDHMASAGWGQVFLVDSPWFLMFHPISDKASRVVWGETRLSTEGDWPLWNGTAAASDLVVLDDALPHGPRFAELRSTWGACITLELPRFTVIQPARC